MPLIAAANRLHRRLTRWWYTDAALERARANLDRYCASVLRAAVQGRLTEPRRAEHPDVEPASVVLERIKAEREAGKASARTPRTVH